MMPGALTALVASLQAKLSEAQKAARNVKGGPASKEHQEVAAVQKILDFLQGGGDIRMVDGQPNDAAAQPQSDAHRALLSSKRGTK